MLLSIFQRYKMKANHNNSIILININKAVINISKIQNESKSQLTININSHSFGCYQYFKDTK